MDVNKFVHKNWRQSGLFVYVEKVLDSLFQLVKIEAKTKSFALHLCFCLLCSKRKELCLHWWQHSIKINCLHLDGLKYLSACLFAALLKACADGTVCITNMHLTSKTHSHDKTCSESAHTCTTQETNTELPNTTTESVTAKKTFDLSRLNTFFSDKSLFYCRIRSLHFIESIKLF